VAKVSEPTAFHGIGFASRDTGALFFSGAALLIGGIADANPFGAWIQGCRFPKWGFDNRIGIGVEGSTDCLIEDCTFEGVGSALDIGIYVQGACQNITIRNNIFRQCTAAIQYGAFSGGGPHAIIDSNIVEDGVTLDSQVNTAPSFLVNNYSELANTSAYDDTIGTLQGQGIQFSGNHYSE
jgi:parallel beta-helix repeat protein